jgi:glycerol-3-phosphate dehydrogenase
MTRDLRRLADTRFDLVVVGAGFYGALAAWDATLRGLSVALIDKGDFGGATSANNFKTLHGGLRSLQSMNLTQMRLFIRERRALARVAPHLVRPMPFVVPTYAHPLRSATTMRFALATNDLISSDRHEGLDDPALQLPRGEVLSRTECLQLNPLVDARGVTGGALWHDYQMHNTDRMTFSFVVSAAEHGAAAANYVQATGLLREGARIAGVQVSDQCSTDTFDLHAHCVLNATGAWAASFLELTGAEHRKPAPLLSRAMNLVTRQVGVAQGCGGRASGRFLFLVPWRDASIVGTSHDAHAGPADGLEVTSQDVEAFLRQVQEAFPHAGLTLADIRLVHRGLLPMVSGHGDHVRLLRESVVVDHAQDGAAGLLSMFGVRYTTARYTAARAVDGVFRARGNGRAPQCRTDRTAVAGGDISNKEAFLRAALRRESEGLSQSTLRRLALTYGTRYERVLDVIQEDAKLADPLASSCDVTGAEVVYAARHESALSLTDALVRRTEAGSAGHPGADAVARGGALIAAELGWRDERLREEIARVDQFYRLAATV